MFLKFCFLLCLFYIINTDEQCELNEEGTCEGTAKKKQRVVEQVTETPENSFSVIFENQSGKRTELYWDDGADGILQGVIEHDNQITINTYVGHNFYFVHPSLKSHRLYSAIMYKHTAIVTLFDEQTMKRRDQEFEDKKQAFLSEYYEETGRRWQNYYPRQPVTHYYHNISYIGQEIIVNTTRDHFYKCPPSELSQIPGDILLELQNKENEWLEDNSNELHNIKTIHPLTEHDPNKDRTSSKYDEYKQHQPLPFIEETINDLNISLIRYNETFYCRKLINENNPKQYKIEVLCNKPKVSRIYNFLNDDEINAIINIGLYNGMKRSTVSEEALFTEDRTSMTVWIERTDSIIVDNVLRRIADVMKIDERKLFLNVSSESLQLVHYFPGELYKSHVDYGTDRPHNRFITFLMYLNDVKEGGYTSFPLASNECKDDNNYFGAKPVKGSVVWFYNLFQDGNVDPLTQHYAEPPIECEKWMTNLWIWDEVFTR